MALQRPTRLLRIDKMIDNKGLTRIRVGSNCRKMRVFRDHESETGNVPLGLLVCERVCGRYVCALRLIRVDRNPCPDSIGTHDPIASGRLLESTDAPTPTEVGVVRAECRRQRRNSWFPQSGHRGITRWELAYTARMAVRLDRGEDGVAA